MSTRSSIVYAEVRGTTYHLYHDGFDCWHVYLEITHRAGEDFYQSQEIRIPIDAWKELRQHEDPFEKYLEMSSEELRAEGETWVKARIAECGGLAKGDIRRLMAAAIASMDDPIEKQIADFIDWHTPPWSDPACPRCGEPGFNVAVGCDKCGDKNPNPEEGDA